MKSEFNWFPGHMNKTLKVIESKMPIIDLVIEIVDSRIPVSSSNGQFKVIFKNKPTLTVLSKADIADPEITLLWEKKLKQENKNYIILDNFTKNIVELLIKNINKSVKSKILRDKKNGIDNSLINAIVVGIPNVGKSTLINRIIKNKSVKVGNKPGITRGLQNIQLNKNITLIDTPGVLPAKFDSEETAIKLCAINSIKEEVYEKERVASKLLEYVFNNYRNELLKYYNIITKINKINKIADVYYILEKIATQKKWFITDNSIDISRTISNFLHDLADGKIGKISFEKPEIVEEIN